MSGWVFRCSLLGLAFSLGCETERIHPGLRPDAGVDALGRGGVHGSGGTSNGGAPNGSGASNTGGGPLADSSGPVCREAVSAALPDGATTGAGCGGRSSSAADAGEPPARCVVAPCLWELMKNCLPQGGCVKQTYRAETGYFADVSCGASNDWWAISSGLNISSYRWSEDFYVGDCLCYRMTGIGRPDWFTEFTDSAGRVIAETRGYPKAQVICGPFETLTNKNDYILSNGGLAPGFTRYDVDLGDPECMPWTYPIGACQPGCCPGVPPELPQTPGLPAQPP